MSFIYPSKQQVIHYVCTERPITVEYCPLWRSKQMCNRTQVNKRIILCATPKLLTITDKHLYNILVLILCQKTLFTNSELSTV